ncbi:MAG: hypothetical protein OXB84_03765, partial [Halobacteriovoraceae bacterium]|nr:hypothetical protein [Halobacteriovoraceae bacterium]
KSIEHSFKNEIGKVTSSIENSTKDISKHLTNTTNGINRNNTEIKETRKSIEHSFKNEIGKVTSSIENSTKDISKHFTNATDEMNRSNTEIKGGFENITHILENIAKDISEVASEAIVKALENAMRDFNDNLKEIFGNNFDQLNNACLKMIEWQDRYKDQVQQGIQNLNSINTTLEKSSEAHEKVVENSKEFASISKNIADLINSCNGHVEVMSTLLKEYGNLSEKAKSMFKNSEAGFKNINKEMDKFSNDIQSTLRIQSQVVTNLTKGIEKALPESLNTLNQRLTDVTKQFVDAYSKVLKVADRINKNNKS